MRPLLLTCLTITLLGCDRRESNRGAAVGASTQPVRTGTAVIRGVVALAGQLPLRATIPNKPCHDGAPPLKEEKVVTDGAGHLRNVVVYLEDAPPAAPTSPPAVTLDQMNCQYVPHVVALRTGQTLHVTTDDPAMHNVHGLCTANDPFNFALVHPGQSRDLTFSQPENFPITCDVHPWMKAYVHVFAHPYFAVTQSDGSFEISNVPAGTYTLVAWQENYGMLKQPVTATDHQTSSANFTYQSLSWLDLNSQEGQEYWAAMNLMGKYAAANHAMIHRKIAKALGAKVIAGVENHHNFAWKEQHGGKELIVHRKGATPAGKGALGVIPGSMATPGFTGRPMNRGRSAERVLPFQAPAPGTFPPVTCESAAGTRGRSG